MRYIEENGTITGFTNNEDSFLFDAEDYFLIKDYTWWIDKQGYVRTEVRNNENRIFIKMHNLVMNFNPKPDSILDHINRNKRDNRKINLRVVTKQENALNSKTQVNNTSGIRGVCLNKNTSMWESYLKKNGKKIYLGTFTDKEEAILSRLLGEIKYFGRDNSPQKNIFGDYGL